MKPRAVHMPVIIANTAVALAKHLTLQGYPCDVISYFRTWLNYEGDVNLELDRLSPQERNSNIRAFVDHFFSQEAAKYDIFHYHFFDTLSHGTSFGGWNAFPEREPYWELKLLKEMGKKIIVSPWGSDIRNNSKYSYYMLKFEDNSLELPYPPLSTHTQYNKIWQFAKCADAVVYGDSEFFKHSPYGMMIPIPIDLSELKDLDDIGRSSTKLSVIHAPSNQFIKGTKYVHRLYKKLRERYADRIELKLIHGISNREALGMYAGRGIAIDEINFCFGGVFLLESMYLGRPVVLSPRKEEYLSSDPKVNAPLIAVRNEEDLFEKVCDVLDNSQERLSASRRKAMREYVQEHFSGEVVAEQYGHLYEQLIDNQPIPFYVSQEWMKEYELFIGGKRVDSRDYYRIVTDLLFQRKDFEKLAFELQQGIGLTDNVELLAKLIYLHEITGNETNANMLRANNRALVENLVYRQQYDRVRETCHSGGM